MQVSAIRQVVSFKMGKIYNYFAFIFKRTVTMYSFFNYYSENNGEDHVSLINSQLPECIRVFATKKVTAGFSSKNSCDGRCYVSKIHILLLISCFIYFYLSGVCSTDVCFRPHRDAHHSRLQDLRRNARRSQQCSWIVQRDSQLS